MTAEADPGAEEAADGELSDLEVLTIRSSPIDKVLEETADRERAADATEKAVLAMETAKAAKAEKVKAASVAAKKSKIAATTEDQRGQEGQRIETKGMLQMKTIQEDNGNVAESAQEKVARFKSSLEQSVC